MGITERKEKQKLEIKKMILDASIKLFVEEGFENVTIRKIADLIEYSPTTVYLYFKDKNEIFYNLHELGFQKLAERNQNLAEIANPITRLHKMGENYIDFGMANPEFYDVMFIQRAPMQVLSEMTECDWTHGESALNALKITIEEAMEKGLIKRANVVAVAMAIWGMVHGLVSLATRDRFDKLTEIKDLKALMHQSVNWLLSSIDLSLRK
ncbi:MAG: TetR/AcrR family transcriptional regulator [Bacteroidetes bacterium]|nr:TetR/AcrR family transcriptional regulator [Bacteroidota bacterium]